MGDIVDLDICDTFSPSPKHQDTCCEQLSDVPCSSLEPQWSVGEWTPVSGWGHVRVPVTCGVLCGVSIVSCEDNVWVKVNVGVKETHNLSGGGLVSM